MKRYVTITIVLSCALCLIMPTISCSPPTGGGSEAGNARITGRVIDSEGLPAAHTIVSVQVSDYNPLADSTITSPVTDTTDANGIYHLNVNENSMYTITAVHKHTRHRAMIASIHADIATDTIAPCILSYPGSIRVLTPDEHKNETGYIFIPGTSFYKKVQPSSDFTLLDSIPSGVIPGITYTKQKDSVQFQLSQSIAVKSNDTTTLLPGWDYAQSITLNTSSDGAGISSTLYNFPVLIRLSSANFTFAQSTLQGNDLRFISSNGSVLPYEIEQWDSIGQRASLWVNLDTIHGNNSKQSIMMFWGSSTLHSADKHVFDTSAGFQGTWHLSDNGKTSSDATPNSYHGLSPDTALPLSERGIIGDCKRFDGLSDYIVVPNTANSTLNFGATDAYTVSAWVSLDTIDNMAQLIVAKGYAQYFLRLTYFPSNAPLWEFSEFSTATSWDASTTAAVARQWVQLTGIRNGNNQMLYLNGVLVNTVPNVYQSTSLTRNTSQDVTIGRFMERVTLSGEISSYCFFKGLIDEVRIEKGARSADWIRLCYMNQRPDDKLVIFNK
ncbi:MAG: DUF2341 domain-containing protein [Fibrobacter sp.]|nr:DUF2341 domain-containing protein [Fibrobacter sp.]